VAGGADPSSNDVVGVVVVDHGSRRSDANQLQEDFVRSWAAVDGVAIVEPAHMELAEPSLAAAFSTCVQAGATTVVIAPYFLGPGAHWDQDIPRLAADAARLHPGVRYLVTAPLGPHPLLADIIEDRVRRCLAHARGEEGPCALCGAGGQCRLR
jgi:sirohydrochlorin ferrochelatase